jgi:hypothetical protein
MDGIQQIGFAMPVITTDTNNRFGETEFPVGIVLKLQQRYRLQVQHR